MQESRLISRVRFARLSRIREILGGTKDEIEYPTDANKFVEDDEYLILDLVLGWVSLPALRMVLTDRCRMGYC